MDEAFIEIMKFIGYPGIVIAGIYLGFYYFGNVSKEQLFKTWKKILRFYLKILVFSGLVVVMLYGGDYLSMMDIEIYKQTGRMGLFGYIANNTFLLFGTILVIPFLIVNSMRFWKKFE